MKGKGGGGRGGRRRKDGRKGRKDVMIETRCTYVAPTIETREVPRYSKLPCTKMRGVEGAGKVVRKGATKWRSLKFIVEAWRLGPGVTTLSTYSQ